MMMIIIIIIIILLGFKLTCKCHMLDKGIQANTQHTPSFELMSSPLFNSSFTVSASPFSEAMCRSGCLSCKETQ